MLNLIIKDILVQKKNLLFALAYCFFFVFTLQALKGITPIAATTAVVYILIQYSFAYEDKNKSEVMLNSLPISRKEIVLAKYLSIFVYIGLAIIAYVIAALVIMTIRIPIRMESLSFQHISITLLLVSFMNSIYLPIVFKIGYLRAKMVNMIVFLLFFFMPMGLASLYQHPKYGLFFGDIIKGLSAWSDWQVASLLATLALMLLSGSYFISLNIYKNREF